MFFKCFEHSCSHRTIATHEMVKALLCVLPVNWRQFKSNTPMFVVFGGSVARTGVLNHGGRPCMCTSCDMRSPKTTVRTSVGVEVAFRTIWICYDMCRVLSLSPFVTHFGKHVSAFDQGANQISWVSNCESSSRQSFSSKLEIIPRILPDSVANVCERDHIMHLSGLQYDTSKQCCSYCLAGRDLHDAHSSMNLPSPKEPSSPTQLSPLREEGLKHRQGSCCARWRLRPLSGQTELLLCRQTMRHRMPGWNMVKQIRKKWCDPRI